MFRARTKGAETFRVSSTPWRRKTALHDAETRRGTGTVLHVVSRVSRWSGASSEGETDEQNQARICDIRSTKSGHPSSGGGYVAVSLVQRWIRHGKGHGRPVRLPEKQKEKPKEKGRENERRIRRSHLRGHVTRGK